MDGLIAFLVLLALGFFVGRRFERQHFKDLRVREARTRPLPITNMGAKQPLPEAAQVQLFVGSVVVSSDYFKTFLAGLKTLVGGRLTTFETLLERGRREAILRMKESALQWGAKAVINVRIETTELGGKAGNGLIALEVIAYGTGIQ